MMSTGNPQINVTRLRDPLGINDILNTNAVKTDVKVFPKFFIRFFIRFFILNWFIVRIFIRLILI